MACMTSGASSVTLQSLYWRSSDNFLFLQSHRESIGAVPQEDSKMRSLNPVALEKGRSVGAAEALAQNRDDRVGIPYQCALIPTRLAALGDLLFSRGGGASGARVAPL